MFLKPIPLLLSRRREAAAGRGAAEWGFRLLFAPMIVMASAAPAQESDSEASSTWFNTLRDPTVLASRLSVGYEYADRDHGFLRNKMTVSGAYAFGAGELRDWTISAELPFFHDEPGDLGGALRNGVGDLKFGAGHVFDGVGRFRWGLGTAVSFPTASAPEFGDGVVKLSPIVGLGVRLLPGLELTGNLQHNTSVHEKHGRTPVHSLEVKPRLIKTWPHRLYTLVGWDSRFNFEDANAYRGVLKFEVGKALGLQQQWVAFLGCDVPVVNAGRDDFSLKVGLNRVFR